MSSTRIQSLLDQVSEERLTELTIELVSRESEAPPGNEAVVGQWITEFIQNLGLPVQKQDCENGRFNVIVDIPGQDSSLKPYLYIGHMDVVPPGDLAQWETPPYQPQLRNGRIYGRGTSDMKGSIACMLHIAELLAGSHTQPPRPLRLLFNIDEEHQNLGLWKYLETKPEAELALIGEPTGAQIHLGHRGVMAFQVDFNGKGAHAARPQLGINAIEQAVDFCKQAEQLNQTLLQQPDPLLGPGMISVTMIEGGTKVNVVPQSCRVRLDRRLTAGETPEAALHQMETLAAAYPQATVAITTCCPVGRIDETSPHVKRMQDAFAEANGREAEISVFPATCEAGLFEEHTGVPALIFGPGDIAQAHQTNEYIETQSLYTAAKAFLAFFLK